MQLDLLSYIASKPYPKSAGFKDRTTSRDAAARVESSGVAELLRQKCLAALKDGGATTRELAEHFNVDKTSVRPRLSELRARNLITESGIRRNGEHVWKLTTGH